MTAIQQRTSCFVWSTLDPIFLSGSFIGSSPFADALGKSDTHVIVTQVVPSPWEETLPLVREYRADLRSMDPSASADFGDLEGYIASRHIGKFKRRSMKTRCLQENPAPPRAWRKPRANYPDPRRTHPRYWLLIDWT
jgi:hypothetical protein